MNYTKYSSKKNETPQSEPLEGQVPNNAGGFAYQITKWQSLDRFLILGTEGGTYYVSEKDLTKASVKTVLECIKEDGNKVLERVLEISKSGRGIKNDPCIFVLALLCAQGAPEVRKEAYRAIPAVCRIGTFLFSFCQYINTIGKWSRGMRKGVASFYTDKLPEDVLYQALKYRQRNGWTHRDVLRLAHPSSEKLNTIFAWIVGKQESLNYKLFKDYTALSSMKLENEKEVVKILQDNDKITWEMLPTELLNSKLVWEHLLPTMPMTAMIRNLNKMTASGVLVASNKHVETVCDRLKDEKQLRKARIHPFQALLAMKTYAQGHGFKGSLTWDPVSKIVDALQDAFYLSFNNVEPTGKKILIGLDVSGSMSSSMGNSPLSVREASSAMCMITARTEQHYSIMAFAHQFIPLDISPKMRLDTICQKTEAISFGGTDCSLPMLYAIKNDLDIDAFIVYTDSETWAGNSHPVEALAKYNKKFKKNAKLIVVGMTSTDVSIADPKNPLMLDIVGFDSAAPLAIAEFLRM